jgi:hypothetical protein
MRHNPIDETSTLQSTLRLGTQRVCREYGRTFLQSHYWEFLSGRNRDTSATAERQGSNHWGLDCVLVLIAPASLRFSLRTAAGTG